MKLKVFKRMCLSFLLLFVLFIVCRFETFAETTEGIGESNNSCGQNATWSFDESSATFTVHGTGDMTEYSMAADIPWIDLLDSIKTVVIEDGITSIGNFAFTNCPNLTVVTIPNTVIKIGFQAFAYDYALETFIMPDSITEMGDYCFMNCNELKNVTLSHHLEAISQNGFNGCEALETITIPESVKLLGATCFSGCTSLKTVHLPENYDIRFTNGMFYKTPWILENTLIGHCGANAKFELKYELPEEEEDEYYPNYYVTLSIFGSGRMEDYPSYTQQPWAGERSNIDAIDIGEKITEIGSYAFYDTIHAMTLSGGEGLVRIDRKAFENCGYFEEAMNNAEEFISWNGFLLYYNAGESTDIIIPDDITTICPYVFERAEITSIDLNKVKRVGPYSFRFIKTLTEIVFPESVMSIEYDAFDNCTALTTMVVKNPNTEIESKAFSGCSALNNVTMPSTVLYEYYMFRSCPWMNNNSAQNNGKTYYFNDGPLYVKAEGLIGDAPWLDASFADQITAVYLQSGVTSLCDEAFRGLASLEKVEIAASCKTIGNHAFADCPKLNKVTIKEGVATIGTGAFENCPSLTDVKLPDSITSVGENAFSGCPVTPELPEKPVNPEIPVNPDDSTTKPGEDAGIEKNPDDENNNVNDSNTETDVNTGASGNTGITDPSVKIPITPTISKIENLANGTKITWNTVEGATEYTLYRKTGNKGWVKVGDVTAATYIDKKAKTNGTKYQYKVTAKNSAGTSVESAIVTSYYMTKVKITKATNVKGKKATIQWSKNKKASGYAIKYVTGKMTKTVYVNKAKTVKSTIKKLAKGKTYKVYVSAFKKIGKVRYLAPWSAAKKVKIKK